MTLPNYTPPEETLSEALHAQLNAVAEDSLMTGQPKAVGLSALSYGLYEYDGVEWQISQSADWPESVIASLAKDGTRIKLGEKLAPLVTFDPTGLSSVFELNLEGDDQSFCLASVGDGRVTLEYSSCSA